MAGKNHVERSIRVLLDDSGGTARDLSGDLVPGSMSGPGLSYEEAQMTGVSETVRNFLAGHATTEFVGQFRMNDTATTGSTTVINGKLGSTGTITVQFGQAGAAPTTGDPEWEGEFVFLAAPVGIADNGTVLNFRAVPTGSTAPAWGTV